MLDAPLRWIADNKWNACVVCMRDVETNGQTRKKGCMRVCPENRLLPSVQGWVTPMGRAGDGGNEVRYWQLISMTGPAHPPPPLPHPPSSCRPTTRIHGSKQWQHSCSPTTSADDDDMGPTILGRKELLSDMDLITTAKTNEQASKRVDSRSVPLAMHFESVPVSTG